MAETTDRPQGTAEVPSAAAPTAAESYRPLSLLALAGFGLAVVYALVVLAGGLVALIGRVPWLMPGWAFLLPLAALIVCWAARLRIRASEDTLSGLAFTTWGFRLTIILALTYTAYYTVAFFTVRHTAIVFVDHFFEALKEGHTEQSFLLALGVPLKDMEERDLRDMLEVKFNAPGGAPGAVGGYTRYRQSEYVRLIEMGGAQTRIVSLGVVDWDYGKDGYRVVLRYRIVTALAEFDANVEALGRDSKPGEGKGRQWRIPLDKGGVQVVPGSLKPTERGVEIMHQSKMAQTFAAAWTEKVNRQEWAEAYWDTLPPADRSPAHAGQKIAHLVGLAPLAGSAVFGLCAAAERDLLPGQQTLAASKIVHIDDKTFWAGKQQLAAIRQRIEKTFHPSSMARPVVNLRLQQGMPRMSEKDGRTTIVFDLGLNYLSDSGANIQYVAEGRLVVRSESSDADRIPSAWRIESIEMETGRTPPAAPKPGQPPRGPGGAPPPQP